MVNYGDSEFRQWVAENDYDEQDLKLIKKTCAKRMFIYFLFGGGWTIMPFVSTLFINEWAQYKIIKQGTFNPRYGLFFGIASLTHFISFIYIIPIIFNAIVKKTGKFTSLYYLSKKGFIGYGEDGRKRYEEYKKIRKVPHIIRLVICVIISVIVFFLINKEADSTEAAYTVAGIIFIFAELLGLIVTTIIDNIKYNKWLNS